METKNFKGIWLDCKEDTKKVDSTGIQIDVKMFTSRIEDVILLIFYSKGMTMHPKSVYYVNPLYLMNNNTQDRPLNGSAFLKYLNDKVLIEADYRLYIINRNEFNEAINKLLEGKKCSVG